MKVITDEKKIDEVLSRGVITSVLPIKEDFKKLLMSGKRIKIYIGFDATADTLHLSHAKNIILLEEFRKLGHEAILLFGDFTARIGDPSDQAGTRKILTAREVLDNVKSWKNQIKNLMDFNNKENPPKVLFNSKWLAKMTMEEVLELASNITVGQMIERDMFQKRMKEGKHIFLHEFLYPLMQGYDSVAMEVDAELCGTDQIFNALMGRTLLRKLKNKEKFVVAVNLMENPKTGELMSKSRGTGVFLNTTATEMFGSIMAQPDEMIEVLLINCTRVSKEEIKEIIKQGPLEAKKKTATEIIKIIFSEKKAKEAEENFVKTFQKKEIPDEMEEIKAGTGELLSEILVKNKILSSKGEWRRLVLENAIHNLGNNNNITDVNLKVLENLTLKIGKKRFVKILTN
ncbi:tyrosine--tRNA ligase [Candidatus Nomurabacteria bacterium GWB1_40_6]|uniref:Tyrosine--tRNA ligase n=1 Tax=Candidatus Nomurabacteria bacterium GWB1_40_6 TaxID=1801727 RepID=A0A1F6TLT4_9BACT|nr:MAG: tyrosine--tRNA ligase [Candidatus Nomurabacteria bacterium GWB1_40_6]